jgi:hypothetical protein
MITASKVIQVGKVRAIAGLTWQHLSAEADPLQEARLEAKEKGTKWAIIHRAPDFSYSRYGLMAPGTDKDAKGAYSAAMWLAATVDRPTIYVEAQDDRGSRYWVVAVRPGEVDPTTDGIFDEDVAKARLRQVVGSSIAAKGEVRFVVGGRGILPNDPIIDRVSTEKANFKDLVSGPPPKEARLIQIAGIKPGVVIGLMAMVLLVGAGIVGAKLYQDQQRKQRFEAEMARAAAEQARLAELGNITQLRIAQAVTVAAEEETATPDPARAMAACLGTTRQFPAWLGGWRLQSTTCDFTARTAQATYQRRSNQRRANPTYEDLMTASRAIGLEPGIDIGQDLASASIALDLGENRPARSREALPVVREVLTAIPSRAQLIENVGQGVGLRFEPAQPRPIVYLDPENEHADGANRFKPVPEDQGFQKGSFTLSGNVLWLASTSSQALSHPAITVRELRLTAVTADNYQWHLSGTYVGR